MAKIIFNKCNISYPVLNFSKAHLKNIVVNFLTKNKFDYRAKKIQHIDALTDINIKISKGERVAIMGRNGAGKTTFLRTVSQIYNPSSGNVEVRGRINPFFDLSMGVDFDSTGLETIIHRCLINGVPYREIKSLIPHIVKIASIGKFVDLPIRIYSSGMRMRLLFAIAVTVPCEILLMDEWLSVGDSEFNAQAAKLIDSKIISSDIFVIATHSMALAKKLCNRIVILDKGRIVDDKIIK